MFFFYWRVIFRCQPIHILSGLRWFLTSGLMSWFHLIFFIFSALKCSWFSIPLAKHYNSKNFKAHQIKRSVIYVFGHIMTFLWPCCTNVPRLVKFYSLLWKFFFVCSFHAKVLHTGVTLHLKERGGVQIISTHLVVKLYSSIINHAVINTINYI